MSARVWRRRRRNRAYMVAWRATIRRYPDILEGERADAWRRGTRRRHVQVHRDAIEAARVYAATWLEQHP